MKIEYTNNLIRYAYNEKHDCSVMALSTAIAMPYDKAWDLLRDHGRRARSGVRLTPLTNAYRAAMGLEYQPVAGRPTIEQFTQDHDTGTWIVRLSNHVFVLRDGVQMDVQVNSKYRHVLGYWRVGA
jgi:hypothetical protein